MRGVWFRKATWFATLIRKLAGLIGKLANKVDWRGDRPKGVTLADIQSIFLLAEPGMVILTHTDYNLLNLLISGKWDHAMLYSAYNKIIEATSAGVNEKSLYLALSHCDSICLLKPIFADKNLMDKAVDFARSQLGKEYDYNFEYQLDGDEKYYCSEVIWASYDHACQPLAAPFQPDYHLGQFTLSPQDIRDSEYWSLIYETPKKG